MSSSEASPSTSSQSGWLPFQCPACFELFRARRHRLQQIGKCPGCQAPVRLLDPLPETSSPSRVSPEKGNADREGGADRSPQSQAQENEAPKPVRKYRRGAARLDEKLDWEDDPQEESGGIPWKAIFGSVLGLAILAVGAAYMVKSYSKPKPNHQSLSLIETDEDLARIEETLALTQNKMKQEVDDTAEEAMKQFSEFDIPLVGERVMNFISAKTFEEQSKFSRNPEQTLAIMREFYRKNTFEPLGFRKFEERKISYLDPFISSTVQLDDFTHKPIVVEKVGDKYFIDWESWVGYCAVSVEQLQKEQPKEPVEVRVVVNNQDYYNYEFHDDKKWKSYRLSFRSSDQALWGYVERGSELHEKIEDDFTSSMILSVAYPEKVRSQSQVFIMDHITGGWVRGLQK